MSKYQNEINVQKFATSESRIQMLNEGYPRPVFFSPLEIPKGISVYTQLWKITIVNGKPHYKMAMFNSKLLVIFSYNHFG